MSDRDHNAHLEVCSLSVQFKQGKRRVSVFEDLTFNVAAGEFLCIVGLSGCGKSTLLHTIAGLPPAFPPQGGEIKMEGKRVNGPGRDRVMVFQEYAIYPWRTAQENVRFGLEIAQVPIAQQTQLVDHYLKFIGLSEFRDAYPHQLSGGMRQRVALARTLVMKPKLLLMDEPFAAVDAMTRLELQKELVRIWEIERPTVLFVTHNIEEALFLGSRVIVLSPRPARILFNEPICITRPRVLGDIRSQPNFISLERQISEKLGVG